VKNKEFCGEHITNEIEEQRIMILEDKQQRDSEAEKEKNKPNKPEKIP